MNTQDRNPHDDDTGNGPVSDERLLWQLRALRREQLPAVDLWPGIAARLAQQPAPAAGGNVVPLRRRRIARLAPWGLAASLALAVGVAWQQRPESVAPQPSALSVRAPGQAPIHREAEAMTREYAAALRELQAAGRPAGEIGGTLRQLDRCARQIRTALQRDPDARFLLERLRHTYEKRLELTQRATLS